MPLAIKRLWLFKPRRICEECTRGEFAAEKRCGELATLRFVMLALRRIGTHWQGVLTMVKLRQIRSREAMVKIPSQLSSIKVNFVPCLSKVTIHLAAAGFFGGCLFSALRYSLELGSSLL